MSSLTAPRYELPLIDPETGRISREWYKFLVQLAKAVGPSTTNADDIAFQENSDIAQVEAMAITARANASDALALQLLLPHDAPKPVDLSLLAWWPMDTK